MYPISLDNENCRVPQTRDIDLKKILVQWATNRDTSGKARKYFYALKKRFVDVIGLTPSFTDLFLHPHSAPPRNPKSPTDLKTKVVMMKMWWVSFK